MATAIRHARGAEEAIDNPWGEKLSCVPTSGEILGWLTDADMVVVSKRRLRWIIDRLTDNRYSGAESIRTVAKRAFGERNWAAVHTLGALGDRLARDGSVTFISGALADRPSPQSTAVLAATSAAMEAFARGLALELTPVRVNTLSPGTTDTPLLARTLGAHRDAYVAALTEKLPQRRLGAAAVFLMSNGFMNGETLHVDGGARLV